ncbi:MAG: DUF4143 domain-containing protein [Candidatus Methanomethylophilaceae archaeon]|nr:DUF4143 domain-containing protein [Candidatus Methanomethylophilaceae archaeon]
MAGLTADRSKVKLCMLDTGLLFMLAFGRSSGAIKTKLKEIMDGKLSVNRGAFFENVVAQQLSSCGRDLFFHEFSEGKRRYEIDFLLASGEGLFPLEAKSSSSTRHRSLDVFCSAYSKRIDKCYVVWGKDLRH